MSKKRKTRQEKIIADLRQQLVAGKTKDFEVRNVKLETGNRSERLETSENISHFPSPNLSSHLPDSLASLRSGPAGGSFPTSTAYIKKDLTKTLALAILAISLEFVLYFILG